MRCRRFIAAFGAVAAVTVAGCGDPEDEDGDDGGGYDLDGPDGSPAETRVE